MVVDTSALLAILLGEAEAATFARAIATGGRGLVSSFSLLEAGLVIESRKGAVGARELDLLVARAGLECVALSPEQAELAREAWRRYGKGRHPAALNIGDCCSYALARYTGEPLLFKGGDFSLTDIAAVAVDASPGS